MVVSDLTRKGLVVLAIFAFVGCVYFTSWGDVMKGWVGHNIDEITALWGEPDEIIPIGKSQKEYKYFRRKVDPSCIHYWVVNTQGIITGFHYEGHCRPI